MPSFSDDVLADLARSAKQKLEDIHALGDTMRNQAQWYVTANEALPRRNPEDYRSIAGDYTTGVEDHNGGRSKLSDYGADRTENKKAIRGLKGVLAASGAFAEEVMEEPGTPMVRRTANTVLHDNVSPRGSCGSSPERIRKALMDFEIYVDAERESQKPVADDDVRKPAEVSPNGTDAQTLGIQRRFLPAFAAFQGLEAASIEPKESAVQRRALQELDLDLSIFGESKTSSLVNSVVKEAQSEESRAGAVATSQYIGPLPRPNQAEGHHDVSGKENVEPVKSIENSVTKDKKKSRGADPQLMRSARSRQQVRPSGMSQVEWLRRSRRE